MVNEMEVLNNILEKIWQALDQLLQKATYIYPKRTEAKTCCHIAEEPFSKVVTYSILESMFMLKISKIFLFFWKKSKYV